MKLVTRQTIRSAKHSNSPLNRCIVEFLEQRRLLTNTIEVTIPTQADAISAKSVQDLPLQFKLHDVLGTLTATGENLAIQNVGNQINITGTVSEFNDLTLATTSPLSTIAFSSKAVDFPLLSFESTGPMKSISLQPLLLNGSASFLAAPKVQLGDGKGATIDVSQTIPFSTFTAGSFSNSQINFTAANPTASAPALSLGFRDLMDTHIDASQFIKTLNVHSAAESTAGASGITANSIGSFNVATNYKADFKLQPSFGLKYTLDNYKIGGTAYGNWDVPGATRLSYANTYDSSYVGYFGAIGTFAVGKDFNGSLTAWSIGTGVIGHNMNNATINLTDSYTPTSYDLGTFRVGNEILSSDINSSGNLGTILTMFTFGSRIQAGVSSSYIYGQPLTSMSYTSNSIIKSFTSDCPSHHNIHFGGSYVGAYDLQNIHLGNVQTQYYGLPFGMAGVKMDHVSVLLNSKAVNLTGLNSAATLDTGLQKYGLTEASLVDFKLLFPM